MIRMLVASLLLLIGGLGDAGAPDPQKARTWTETPVAFCRYELDVSSLDDPHQRLDDLAKDDQVVCPFAAKATRRVALFTETMGKRSCDSGDIPGFSVLDAELLTQHEFGSQLRSCGLFVAQPGQREKAPGKVYIITFRAADASQFGRVSSRVDAIVAREGLPVRAISVQGLGPNGYLCLEMTADADIDPFTYFRSKGVDLPPPAHELTSTAPNCFQAVMEAQHVPRAQMADALAGAAGPMPQPFRLEVRGSSTSPTGKPFEDAFLHSLDEAGLPHEVSADGEFSPMSPNDTRPLVVEAVRPTRVSFQFDHLTAKLCDATFATMVKTQGFIPPQDDQSPTIVLAGTTGGPPPRYLAISVRFVGSSEELCKVLKPAFDRWAESRIGR